ncbi:hypothetical protein [Clostridium aciditolerans]|uniref:Uncharacterized protein n=1 Tax=Clostridium aciditolerans TaxID=339861 RepID=A0A934I3Z7_9CLOT|nr:hypothetical protein [Clostridium aciditolerans]MBI6875605.1 hypothetical protein [Clostridium aciditolerans]
MKAGEKIKKVILNLQDEDGLYSHNFRISEEDIMYDENRNKVDLKEIIFAEIYSNEMILHLKNDDRYLLTYEGIDKLDASKK